MLGSICRYELHEVAALDVESGSRQEEGASIDTELATGLEQC